MNTHPPTLKTIVIAGGGFADVAPLSTEQARATPIEHPQP